MESDATQQSGAPRQLGFLTAFIAVVSLCILVFVLFPPTPATIGPNPDDLAFEGDGNPSQPGGEQSPDQPGSDGGGFDGPSPADPPPLSLPAGDRPEPVPSEPRPPIPPVEPTPPATPNQPTPPTTSSPRPTTSSEPTAPTTGPSTSDPSTTQPTTTRPTTTRPTTTQPTTTPPTSRPTTTPPTTSDGGGGGEWAHNWGSDPGVAGRIEDWIDGPVVDAARFGVIANDGASDTDAIDRALDSIPGGGVVLLPAGEVHSDSTISLASGQVLRGQGTAVTFTRDMTWGIELGGGYAKATGTVSSARTGSNQLTVRASKPSVGQHAVLKGGPGRSRSAGEVVEITAVSAAGSNWAISIRQPLSQDLDGAEFLPFNAGKGMGVEDLAVGPAPGVNVDHNIVLRGSESSWVRNVNSRLARRSHVYTRQSSNCEISNSTFTDATEHGDGGRGYGINIANRTTGCLVVQNRLSLLRHSMLLHDGATANVVAYNTSTDPRHTNFVNGGPADMSFHGIATANLVEGNIVERVQLTDAGVAGSGNAILRNCFTSGPPTLKNSPRNTVIMGNTIMGSNSQLRARTMPAVEGSAARAYTSNALFDDDGILIQGNTPGLIASGNWFGGRYSSAQSAVPKSAIQASTLVPNTPTGNDVTDCPYAPRP